MEQIGTTLALKAGEKLIEKVAGGKAADRKAKRKAKKALKKAEKGKIATKTVAQTPKKKGGVSAKGKPVVKDFVFRQPTHFSKKRVSEDRLVVRGRDFMGFVNSTTAAYDDLFTMPLNPLAVAGTRLQIEGCLFQKFRFRTVKLEYFPIVGTSENGQIMLSHIDDPEATPGKPKSIGLFNALCAVPGAVIGPVHSRLTHTFFPVKGDKREFYIQPDVGDEERFTIQAELKIIQSAADDASHALGSVFIEYEIELYQPLLTIANLNAFTSVQSNGGTNWSMSSGGVTGGVILTLAVSAGLSLNTLYLAYFNFSYEGLKPFAFVWFHVTNVTMGTPVNLYLTAYDAQNGTLENQVPGSFFGGSVPNNATMYWSRSFTLPPGGKRDMLDELSKERDELERLKARIVELELLKRKEKEEQDTGVGRTPVVQRKQT